MKKIKGTNYLATETISGSMLLGKEVNEKTKEEYLTKNLNEECQQTSKKVSC
jgi:hypothetical protein